MPSTPPPRPTCRTCVHWLPLSDWLGQCNHESAAAASYPAGTRTGQYVSCGFHEFRATHATRATAGGDNTDTDSL